MIHLSLYFVKSILKIFCEYFVIILWMYKIIRELWRNLHFPSFLCGKNVIYYYTEEEC